MILDEPDVYMHPDLQRKLFRFIKKGFEAFCEVLSDCLQQLYINTFDCLSEQYRQLNPGRGAKLCNNAARDYLNARWTSLENKIAVVDGKELIKSINGLFRAKFNISCSLKEIMSNLRPEELSREIVKVINSIIQYTGDE